MKRFYTLTIALTLFVSLVVTIIFENISHTKKLTALEDSLLVQLAEFEGRMDKSDERAREAEARAKEAEARAKEAEARAKEADARAKEAERLALLAGTQENDSKVDTVS